VGERRVEITGRGGYQQIPLKILGQIEVRSVRVSFRIVLGLFHVWLDRSISGRFEINDNRAGYSHVVHLGRGQHGTQSKIPAPRLAMNSDPVHVHPRPRCGQLAQCRHVIGNLVTPDAAIHDVLERLAPSGSTPRIDDHRDEVELGERLSDVAILVRQKSAW